MSGFVPRALLAEKEAENARLRAELSALAEPVGRLAETNSALVAEIAKLNDRVAELLAVAQRKKSKQPETKAKEAPPAVEGAVHDAFERRPTPPEPPGPAFDHPRQKFLPTGRKRLPAGLPRDDSTVAPERCRCGCSQFDLVDEVVEEKLHVQAHQRVRRTVRRTGRCRACGRRTTAEAPPSPFERSKVTCEWLAWMIAQKFELHVPLDRLRRSLATQGVPLSISFLVSQVEAAADILGPIDGEHWKQLLAGDWMASDGTGIKVQIPKVGLHHGYLEVYHRDDLVVFQYEAEKGGKTQAGKLAKFHGALVVDAESRYNETIRANPGIVEFNCNAHPRRKLRDAEGEQPVLAAEAGRFVSAMFEEEAQAKTLGLTGEALRTWRRERIRPHFDQLQTWMNCVEPTLTPDDTLAKVLRYYRNQWGPLTAFIDNPLVPIDNSASEREFQAVAKLRLNALFAGGTEGAHRASVLLGVAATCKRVQVSFQDYLTWVFIRRGTHRDRFDLPARELTPAAFRRSLEPPPD